MMTSAAVVWVLRSPEAAKRPKKRKSLRKGRCGSSVRTPARDVRTTSLNKPDGQDSVLNMSKHSVAILVIAFECREGGEGGGGHRACLDGAAWHSFAIGCALLT